jgi:hypothetical protein
MPSESLAIEKPRENERRTKTELLAWIEQHQPVTREKLLVAFEDMDYEQLQGWLSGSQGVLFLPAVHLGRRLETATSFPD